jgi:hypothetical protein
MASTLLKDTFATVYKDDYRDSDNFHRILFNSGRALQARELTQLQTIIQAEQERHARFVFKEGAPVTSGDPVISNRYEFVKLNTSTNTLPANATLAVGDGGLVGDVFTGSSNGVKARIVEVVAATDTDPATLYVEYLDGGSSSGNRFSISENIQGATSAVTLTIQTTNTTENPAGGFGCRLSVPQSIYFVAGHFVFVPAQSIILSKYTPEPTLVAGYKVVESIITAQDDTRLYDNQGANPNLTSPGADRYRIRLTLIKQADVLATDTFLPVFNINNGEIRKTQKADESLSQIGDIMAKRHFETHGSFEAVPFKIKARANPDATKLDFVIQPGIAYVEGYRKEFTKTFALTVNKPRTVTSYNNQAISTHYGNYILVKGDTFKGIPDIANFSTVDLKNGYGFSGTTLGTARVRGVHEYGADYRMYLFDINMSIGQSQRNIRSVGVDSASFADAILTGGICELQDKIENNLLMPLLFTRPKSLTDITITKQRLLTGTTNGSGNVTFTLSGATETFTSVGDWVLSVDSSGDHQTISISSGGAGTSSVTLQSLPAGSAVKLLSFINKNGTVRSKTLTDRKATFTPDSDGNIILDRTDIYEIYRIRDNDSNGVDINSKFSYDYGQRDNMYDVGKLILKNGVSAPAGNVRVGFRYFQHGASGDFFAVNSYAGQLAYTDIPSFRQVNGQIASLRDVLDFRSSKDYTGANFTGTGADKFELPSPTEVINADIDYYNGQLHRIVLSADGSFSTYTSDPGRNYRLPDIPLNSMEVARAVLNPYTFNDKDLSITFIENRRFTMKDISSLSKRMDRIEETTTLSLLEVQTETMEVLDSNGLNRLKSGFVADNFTDHLFTDLGAADLHASIDPLNREMRAGFKERNIELVYDSASSTNTIRKGDYVFPKYTEEVYLSQTLASDEEYVNQYNAGILIGSLTLSPQSDHWKEVETAPDKIIDGGISFDATHARNWDEWNWNWTGLDPAKLQQGYAERKYRLNNDQTATGVTNVIKDSFIQSSNTGSKVLLSTTIPKMRSRFISFKAEGLRPNTRYFAFFGVTNSGINVTNFCRGGAAEFFQMGSLLRDSTLLEPGTQYKTSDRFPDDLGGPSDLITDANGALEGVFFVQSNNHVHFYAGHNTFLLSDINGGSLRDKQRALSYAEAIFVTAGTLDTVENEITNTRIYEIEGTVDKYYNVVAINGITTPNTDIAGGEGIILEYVDPRPNPTNPSVYEGDDDAPSGPGTPINGGVNGSNCVPEVDVDICFDMSGVAYSQELAAAEFDYSGLAVENFDFTSDIEMAANMDYHAANIADFNKEVSAASSNYSDYRDAYAGLDFMENTIGTDDDGPSDQGDDDTVDDWDDW